jgi:hypothetical protein
MGKPKRSKGTTAAAARAAQTSVGSAQNTINWLRDGSVGASRHGLDAQHYPLYPEDYQRHEWGVEDEVGPWFIQELLREFPLLAATALRVCMRTNYYYCWHVWFALAGWQTAFSGKGQPLACAKCLTPPGVFHEPELSVHSDSPCRGTSRTRSLALPHPAALASCEAHGPEIKYLYGALLLMLLSAWQRRLVSAVVPYLFALSCSPLKHVYAVFGGLWYLWQRRKGGRRQAMTSMATPFLCAFVMRFLLLTAGPVYTFVLLGVTQTPVVWAMGDQFPSESALLERTITPIFIVAFVLIKDIEFATPVLPAAPAGMPLLALHRGASDFVEPKV